MHLDLGIPINPKYRHGASCLIDFCSGLIKCLGGSPESQDLYLINLLDLIVATSTGQIRQVKFIAKASQICYN